MYLHPKEVLITVFLLGKVSFNQENANKLVRGKKMNKESRICFLELLLKF